MENDLMCVHMYKTKTCYGEPVEVPCGSCVTCLRTKRTFFCHRIQSDVAHLDMNGLGSSFVTMTIAEENNDGKGVDKRKLQLLHKRMRKDGYKFSYLAIGDYGDNTHREHYHGIYLGLDTSSALEGFRKHWKEGFVDVEPVTSSNIAYVVRYVYGQTRSYKKRYEDNGIGAPFTLFSRGLGSSLFENNLDDILTQNRYFWHGKWYSVPASWFAKYGYTKKSTDTVQMRRYRDLAVRYGFSSTQSYLDWKNRTAEYVETRRYQNRLKPPQGIRNTYQNLTPRLPLVHDVNTIIKELYNDL